MREFKIIGAGSTVRRFLETCSSGYKGVRSLVYTRRPVPKLFDRPNIEIRSLDRFQGDYGPTLVCCSVNEEAVLRGNPSDQSRRIVAKENLAVIRRLIGTGVFDKGTYFILTNPSEVIAQFISNQTRNPNIYALGLSVDRARYRKLIERQKSVPVFDLDFQLAGNHWDRSFPVFAKGTRYSREVLDLLYERYQRLVRSEFSGFKPPVQSGADALNHLVEAFVGGDCLPVSAREPACDNFVGGILSTKSLKFSATQVLEEPGKSLCREIFDRHQSFVAEVSA